VDEYNLDPAFPAILCNFARYGRTNNKIILSPQVGQKAFRISSGDPISVGSNGNLAVSGFASAAVGSAFIQTVRGAYEGTDVVVSGTTIILTTSGWSGTAFGTATQGQFTVRGVGVVSNPATISTPMVTRWSLMLITIMAK
jgi:hypothetical protein